MITIRKSSFVPAFSRFLPARPNEDVPSLELTTTGKILPTALDEMTTKYPELEILAKVCMPDHLHFIVFVTKDTSYHLGKAIGFFKGRCSKKLWEQLDIEPGNAYAQPIFEDGFHDRILSRQGQLPTMLNYVRDNPRRAWIKQMNPRLFTDRQTILINNCEYDTFGNLFLLRNPDIQQVRVSSKYTNDELEAHVNTWIRTIEEGGVLVSPFISPAEKAYRDKAIEADANLIILEKNGFPERYKPSGRFFELCAEGRLLLIAPREHRMLSESITRSQALALNELASFIAAGRFTILGRSMRRP